MSDIEDSVSDDEYDQINAKAIFALDQDNYDIKSIFDQVKNKAGSIYHLNVLADPCIIDGKFSAINFDFKEKEWILLGNRYSPTSIDVNNYELTSMDSKFESLICTMAMFIGRRLRKFFPFELPNRHSFELCSIFLNKHPHLEAMFKVYKIHHQKSKKFTDCSVCILYI